MTTVRERVMQQGQGAMRLQIAYVGIVNGLLEALRGTAATPAKLAEAAGVDVGYVARWCDAAYAFELVDFDGDEVQLTPLGDAFRPSHDETLMPFAVQVVLGAHMSERAAGLMKTGERPGESVLAERDTVMPWFGPMLERTFGPFFETHVVDEVPVFARVDERGGLVVDLGCGNGWYLRALARRCPRVRGVGLDMFEENVQQAAELADREGVGDRLEFRRGDLNNFAVDEPVDLVAMNRALHHVWTERDNVFRILREHLAPGGAAVVWEPRWSEDRTRLRTPRGRPIAFHNLSEHVQGNHFLTPEEIADGLSAAGLDPTVHLFADGYEAVVVGYRRS